jgi:hypothetical protein
MNSHQIALTRHEDPALLSALMVLSFDCEAVEPADAFEMLKKGITHWVKETENGKALWDYSGGDLNIGDLHSYIVKNDALFVQSMKACGVYYLKVVYELNECCEFPYDTILADIPDHEPE